MGAVIRSKCDRFLLLASLLVVGGALFCVQAAEVQKSGRVATPVDAPAETRRIIAPVSTHYIADPAMRGWVWFKKLRIFLKARFPVTEEGH
jgi:hypothetical protein